MAKITLKLNERDLNRILAKGKKLEKALMAKDGALYGYTLTLCDGYTEAVISGMGQTTTGVLTLKSFLGRAESVNWKPLAPKTLRLKTKNAWTLEIWEASGMTKKAVIGSKRVIRSAKKIEMFAGIDGSEYTEEFYKAYQTEFGGVSDPGMRPFNGRALFTLLNKVFKGSTRQIIKELRAAVRSVIAENWGT